MEMRRDMKINDLDIGIRALDMQELYLSYGKAGTLDLARFVERSVACPQRESIASNFQTG